MPGDKPARSAQEEADKLQKSAGEHGMKGPGRGAVVASPAPVGGGGDADRGPVGEGLENAEQNQLDRELAAIGRQDRPGLPAKPDAGGGAKLEKGTTLSDGTSGVGKPPYP
jgi:hypothetical protein